MTEMDRILLATEITARIERLRREVDSLLDPILKKAATMQEAELENLFTMLPAGFHRTEVRYLLNEKYFARVRGTHA